MNQRYELGRIVGILMVVLSSLGACGLVVIGGVVGLVFGVVMKTVFSPLTDLPKPTNQAAMNALPLFVGAILVLFLIFLLLNIVIAFGVMKSSRRAFIWAAVTSGTCTVLSMTGADGYFGFTPCVACFIYCLLRLNGSLGPKL